jgi:hypothetical protein
VYIARAEEQYSPPVIKLQVSGAAQFSDFTLQVSGAAQFSDLTLQVSGAAQFSGSASSSSSPDLPNSCSTWRFNCIISAFRKKVFHPMMLSEW